MKSNTLVFWIVISLTVFSCSNDKQSDNSEKQIKVPVTIFEGYKIPASIKENIKITSIEDVKKILSLKWDWNATVAYSSTPDSHFSLSTCNEYLKKSHKEMTTIPYMNNTFFMRVEALCEATKIISNGKSSKKSFMNNIKFNPNLPTLLPPQMAQIISTKESKRILSNKNITSWAQVEPIIKTEILGPYRTKYFIEGGSEELQLVAKGDFNHDGIEDMLVIINDAVEGGSYSATRLFLLTRLTEHGKIKLLQEWPKE